MLSLAGGAVSWAPTNETAMIIINIVALHTLQFLFMAPSLA
jgi:hypothetical protein